MNTTPSTRARVVTTIAGVWAAALVIVTIWQVATRDSERYFYGYGPRTLDIQAHGPEIYKYHHTFDWGTWGATIGVITLLAVLGLVIAVTWTREAQR